MALLREAEMRIRAKRYAREKGLGIAEALGEIARKRAARYDIFLSQTIRDAEIVLGVYDLLAEMGYSIFCDWITAPETHRDEVTPANAAFIRSMMGVSDCLLFLDTEGAVQSRWMCWELGWFDGENGSVAVLPVVREDRKYYHGREFLGLYPYVEVQDDSRLEVIRPPVTNRQGLTMFEVPNSRSFNEWKDSASEFMRPRAL